MKSMQSFLPGAIALSLVTVLFGCQKDDTAIKALQELTAQQAEQVEQQNEELANLTGQIETCKTELAKTKEEAVVITSKDVSFDVPKLGEEVSVASLESLKTAMSETLEKQKAQITELTATNEKCSQDLATAKEEAEAAAATAAAEEEAAATAVEEAVAQAKAAAARRAKKKKPTAVKEREEAGEPTQGVRSRY